VTDKEVVSKIILFDDLSNSISFTERVRFMGILYFNANIVSIKQCVDLESMRA